MQNGPSLSLIDPILWPDVWPYRNVHNGHLASLHDGSALSNKRREFLFQYIHRNNKTERINEAFTPLTKRAIDRYFGYNSMNAYFDKVLCKHNSWTDFLSKQSGQPAIDPPALPHAPSARAYFRAVGGVRLTMEELRARAQKESAESATVAIPERTTAARLLPCVRARCQRLFPVHYNSQRRSKETSAKQKKLLLSGHHRQQQHIMAANPHGADIQLSVQS